MSKGKPKQSRVSSPAATGGAGTFFEQHANASFLALLLVRGIPPICTNCRVVEVHLQTEHLGWNTDDFLVVGETDSGHRRRLVGQVKRSLSVSYSDDDFKGAVLDAWSDFKSGANFDKDTDQFVIVTLLGSSTLIRFFSALLDCARSSKDGVDFEHRLTTPGFVHSKVVDYCDEVRKILDESEGRPVTFEEIRDFLRFIYLLSWDLNTGTSQTEAWVKTLLAHTSNQDDPVASATDTWNALLRLVGSGTPQAAIYFRDNLPTELRTKHTPVTAADDAAIQALSDQTTLLVTGIRTVIGESAHVHRAEVVARVLDDIELSQVVLITGEAGGGKSGVAKAAVEVLMESSCVFAFRAEQFAATHLNATFVGVHPGLITSKLRSLLATHDRKTILIESVERLLEASSRGAFIDLMRMIAHDPTWRLILTCRDYSSDLVRTSFLEYAGLRHSVVTVPPLSDNELAQLRQHCPHLSRPLDNPPLRLLLKNPYFLDMAARLSWSDESPLPANERSLRKKFWREVIRDDGRPGDGMPRRREQAFVEVSLRRARALTAFARCDDLDGAVIDRLRNDALLRLSPNSDNLAAAAHDVLEDWALLEWIDRQFELASQELPALCPVMGTYPALRRTYKKWLSEQVILDPPSAGRILDEAISRTGLPQYFVDDTIVSLLRSSRGSELLEHRWPQLVADGNKLLLRAMHLLRVGCVRTPSWAGASPNIASIMCVPDGGAWSALLKVIRHHLNHFSEPEYGQLISFIEDWSQGVSWQAPYPDGANDAASIVLELLFKVDDYRSEDQRERLLKILVKLPLSVRERFVSLMHSERNDDDWGHLGEELSDLILTEMDGMPSCRDLPDEVVALARKKFILTDVDSDDGYYFGSSMEMESLFGLRLYSHDFFPASAYRGPFLFLLRSHPQKGIAFIIELMNHATEAFAHPRYPMEYVDGPVEMELHFSDGTTRTQWVNDRLWNLYRGTSVGPYLLQSALMALEYWLHELLESVPSVVDTLLVRLLRDSNSAAVSSVVASVVTASPKLCPEAGLVLLRSPECIILDRMRMVHESQAPGRMMEFFPQLDTTKKVYDNERKQSDALAHRSKDLEVAVLNLQLGVAVDRIHAVLDEHRASLPAPDEQNDDVRSWRLALDRMDLRRYRPSDRAAEPVSKRSTDEGANEQHHVALFIEMQPPDPDVQEMVDRTNDEYSAFNRDMGLLMWGQGIFERNEKSSAKPEEWREKLAMAQQLSGNFDDAFGGIDKTSSAQAFVAAICIRDQWSELTSSEQDWCVETICAAIAAKSDESDQMASCQRYSLSGDRPAAFIVSALCGKQLSESQRQQVIRALARALTHGIDEVAEYAASGASLHLWIADSHLAIRCINSLAQQAVLLQRDFDAEKRKTYQERRSIEVLKRESVTSIRRMIEGVETVDEQSHAQFNTRGWIGAHALVRVLLIAKCAPTESVSVQLFRRASEALQYWWGADRRRRGRDSDHSNDRPHRIEPTITTLLERFVLQVSAEDAQFVLEPILAEVERNPREVSRFVRGLTSAEDSLFRPGNFWAIWEQFASRIQNSRLIEKIDDSRYYSGDELMSSIFLGSWWKDEVRHWRSLDGYVERIHKLFLALPPSAVILDDYVRFLYHIGEQSLPSAFMHVASRLQAGSPMQMLSKDNTVFMLESILRRFVYGRPQETKREKTVREAVLFVLDRLVEAGSSAAYRMRDDFVTPIPAGN